MQTHDLTTQQTPIGDLSPHPQNPRNGDTDAIAESLQANGQYRPIVTARGGVILAGNHTYAAAMQLGWESIATVSLDLDPESPEALRIMLADNQTAELGTYDDAILLEIAEYVDEQVGLLGTGFNEQRIRELEEAMEWREKQPLDPNWERYTSAVDVPQYQPTREHPPEIAEMVDDAKTKRLQERIAAAGLPEPVADFLHRAAQRHTVFHYGNIAEFYAHAEPEVQALMEESALVIIDVDDAIRNGYAKLGDYLQEHERHETTPTGETEGVEQ